MSKGLLDLIFDDIFDDKWVGWYGEKLTERELKLVKLFGRKGKILRNIYLPKENGETSEIDVVYLTQKGIFVFESKNYSGWIFGDEKNKNWTAMLPNKQKNQFYNPVLQNRSHLKWMSKYIGDDVPLFSVIVFSERCELKKITMYSDDIKVIKRDSIYATVRNIWNEKPDAVTDEKLEELYVRLQALTKVDKSVKDAHIENIEEKYKDTSKSMPKEEILQESETKQEEKIIEGTPEMICPKCGSKLVLRTARKGANAGNQFYGCSAFPNCRYIQNL